MLAVRQAPGAPLQVRPLRVPAVPLVHDHRQPRCSCPVGHRGQPPVPQVRQILCRLGTDGGALV